MFQKVTEGLKRVVPEGSRKVPGRFLGGFMRVLRHFMEFQVVS